ncbi:MAG: HAMP domain-containing protein, partial [Candidatus Hydrogenedentes bacterium]|nr:HAMP domain-containing protein [Candidatus Hydrogenedentota bacterium]
MFTRISFKLRMALLSMLLSGLVLLGFGGWALFHIQRLELRRYESDIAQYAARHLERPHGSEYWTQVDENLRFVLGDPDENAFIMLVLDREGELLHKSANWPDDLVLEQLPQPTDMPLPPRLEGPPGPEAPPGQQAFPDRPLRGNRGEDPGRENDVSAERPPGGFAGQPPPPFVQGGRPFRGEGPPPGPPPRRGRMGPPPREGEPPRLPARAPEFFNWPDGETTWRVGTFGNPEVTLALGLNHSAFTAHMRQVRMAFAAAFGAALLFIAGGSWLLAWRALRPVDRLAATVERITARGLEQRIPPEAQDAELLRLATVFNEMMDRLERSFYQTTRFSADAAHELKTPLTILQGKIEQALQQAEPGSPTQQNFSQLLGE